jgi:hypothetical protein
MRYLDTQDRGAVVLWFATHAPDMPVGQAVLLAQKLELATVPHADRLRHTADESGLPDPNLSREQNAHALTLEYRGAWGATPSRADVLDLLDSGEAEGA